MSNEVAVARRSAAVRFVVSFLLSMALFCGWLLAHSLDSGRGFDWSFAMFFVVPGCLLIGGVASSLGSKR
jgi:hypothetical protein